MDKLTVSSEPIKATCHCGAITVTVPGKPKTPINECQCTICRRYGAAWAYYNTNDVKIEKKEGSSTRRYVWNDREIEFTWCENCGCVMYWYPVEVSTGDEEMGVNTRRVLQSGHSLCTRWARMAEKRNVRLASTSTSVEGNSPPKGALTGIKVVDLGRVLAAPYCTQILADYGADVIKIEDVEAGDDSRYWKNVGEDASWKKETGPMSNLFAAVNRNKKSFALNLKHEKGREIFLDLVKDADVVVENMRPGGMEKLKIGYETLREINPRIIHSSTSGYGPTGPFAHRAGYDMIVSAEAGLLHVTGEKGRGPVRPGLSLIDLSTGLYMQGAIMGALYVRDRTGVGQKLDGSLFETQVALLANVGLSWLNLGIEAQRWGTQHPSVVPYDAFQAKDGYFVGGALNDKQFSKLVNILGKPELAKDPRYSTNSERVNHRDEISGIVNELFGAKTIAEWNAAFEGSGMPYGGVNTMERVFNHPQAKARDMVVEIEHEAANKGKMNLIGPAIKWSDTPPTIRTRPPLHGEHSDEILRELGKKDDEIKALRSEGTIK